VWRLNNLLMRDEARRIAANVAKLPKLLAKRKSPGEETEAFLGKLVSRLI
jgi:hypothetical protein